MHLIKSIIRKSQMSFDFGKHEEERTVHATTRHMQSGAVAQVKEHQRRTVVATPSQKREEAAAAKNFEVFAVRQERARGDFAEALQNMAGITKEQADRVTQYYLDKKLATMDAVNGTIRAKHGAYLDKEVILNAVQETEPKQQQAADYGDDFYINKYKDIAKKWGASTAKEKARSFLSGAFLSREFGESQERFYARQPKLAKLHQWVTGGFPDMPDKQKPQYTPEASTQKPQVSWSKDRGTQTARIDFPESSKEKHHVKVQLIAERSTRGNYAYGATEYWKDKTSGKMKSIPLLAGGTAQTEEEAKAAIENDLRKWAEERNRPAQKTPSWHQNADLRRSVAHPVSLVKSRKLHGRMDYQGIPISIETGRSRIREWHNPHDNTSGMMLFKDHYGYITNGPDGTDGDKLDAYVGPDMQAENVYIVNQMKAPDFTTFDEQKIMLGYPDEEAARKAYLRHYDKPQFLGSIDTMTLQEFKDKIASGNYNGKIVKSEQDEHSTKCSTEQAKNIGSKLNIDWNKITLSEFHAGLCHEHEHDDITKGDPIKTGKIALVHLKEDPHYYTKLKRAGID